MYKKLTKLLLLLFLAPAVLVSNQALAEEEFLRPDQAFPISAVALGQDKVRVTWQIADGYYLYQSKFRFAAENPLIEFGDPALPQALTKQDPIFGEVQIYRGRIDLDVPFSNVPKGTDVMTIKARSQGCADKGICYPPHTQTVLVALNAEADGPAEVDPQDVSDLGASGSSPGGEAEEIVEVEEVTPDEPQAMPAPPPSHPVEEAFDPLAELSALGDDLGLGGMEDDILSPEEAFQVQAESLDGQTLTVRWDIAEGTYLYQDKLKVELLADGVELGRFAMPEPDIKKDSIKPDGTFGDVPVYHHQAELKIPLLRSNTDATEIEVRTAYQGCADRGICYPPQKTNLKLALPAGSGAGGPAPAAVSATAPVPVKAQPPVQMSADLDAPVNEQDALLTDLKSASLLFSLALALGFGVLVAFTACMYPMIPILTSLIMGQGEKVTAGRSFTLSLAYTQGIALTFAVLGAVMGLVGESISIQGSLQTPWVLVPSVILFVGLALSMFGFYQIQMPSAIQSRLNEISNKQEGGSLIGVALMGVLSALIVGPCGGPVLLAVLAFAAQSQDILLGFLIMWVFGTGMGLPLLLMGAGGGALLPRAGTWMDTVKATGGVIMLALALSFLERMSPTYISVELIMLLWGTLLIVTAVYMGALRNLPDEASGWSRLWKGLGLVLLIYGATFVVGLAAGSKDTLQPLKGVAGGGGVHTQTAHAEFKRIDTVEQLDAAVAAAAAAGKPVMLDFYADWCTYCKTMEKEIFPHPKVVEALDGYVLLQADITRQDEDDKLLAKHLSMPAPPAVYFWNRRGEEMRSHRLIGNATAAQLAARATQVKQQ